MTLYRTAVLAFVFCMVALLLMLAPWAHYYLGPEVSVYDVGAPHLRVMV